MFICLEGIDGAERTSVAKMLTKRLEAGGRKVKFFEHNLARADLLYVNTQLKNLQAIQVQALESPYEQVCELHWVLLYARYYAMAADHVVAPIVRAGEEEPTGTEEQLLAPPDGSSHSYIQAPCPPISSGVTRRVLEKLTR